MIMLVLNGTGEEAVGLEFYHLDIERLSPDPNGTRPGYVTASPRKAQAAFNADLMLPERLYFRVYQDEGHVGFDFDRVAADAKSARPVLDVRDIDYAKLDGHANLLGGETDAIGFIHRLQHVFDKRTDPGIDSVDSPSLGPQGGMAVLDDFQDHVLTYITPRGAVRSTP